MGLTCKLHVLHGFRLSGRGILNLESHRDFEISFEIW